MKLTPEKRKKLIGIGIGTVVAVVAIWYTLIGMQSAALAEARRSVATAQDREQRLADAAKRDGQVQQQLVEANARMTEVKEGMASGDLYSWMYNTLKDFKTDYRVDIPQFSSVVQSDSTMFPKFPFKEVRMTINGNGYFHEIGRFIAGLENTYPYMRLQNLDMSPMAGSTPANREKLSFRVEVVALIDNATQIK